MAVDEIKNFKQVSATLGTAGQPTAPQLGEIASAGYEVVINLGLLDPKYCLPDEAALVAGLGMEYHHIPVVFGSPQVAELERFVDVMEARRGRKIFVHGALNWRVSTFVGLYGELHLGWSRAEADGAIRLFWEPNDVWTAFVEDCRAKLTGTSR